MKTVGLEEPKVGKSALEACTSTSTVKLVTPVLTRHRLPIAPLPLLAGVPPVATRLPVPL